MDLEGEMVLDVGGMKYVESFWDLVSIPNLLNFSQNCECWMSWTCDVISTKYGNVVLNGVWVLHNSTTFTVKQLLRLEQRVEVPERAFYPPRSHGTLRGKGKSTEVAQNVWGIPRNTHTSHVNTSINESGTATAAVRLVRRHFFKAHLHQHRPHLSLHLRTGFQNHDLPTVWGRFNLEHWSPSEAWSLWDSLRWNQMSQIQP